MVKLPASGAEIALRALGGVDEMLLQEALWSEGGGGPVAAGIALLGRLAGEGFDASALVVTDFEFALLTVRAARFGQRMALGFGCPHCRERAEVSFRIAEFLEGVTPRAVKGVVPDAGRPGWFRLEGAGFRLPSAGDLAALVGVSQPARRLAERCLDEVALRKPFRAKVERAMEAMAPGLSRPIAGQCPSCRAQVQAGLSVAGVVVSELARGAGAVHDEVDLIARAYHWPEPEILALPQYRRRAYAERIRRAQPRAA